MCDVSCHVLHDLWRPKCVILAVYSQNTSKNLEILCQCQYASSDNIWQFRHIRLGYVLRRYFMTNLVWISANFRNFKVIVGRIN